MEVVAQGLVFLSCSGKVIQLITPEESRNLMVSEPSLEQTMEKISLAAPKWKEIPLQQGKRSWFHIKQLNIYGWDPSEGS